MQATVRPNASGYDRLKLALITAGLLVTTLAGVAAWQLSQESHTTATSSTADQVVAHHPTDRPFRVIVSAPAMTMQQFSAAKEARQDALELETSTRAAQAAQHWQFDMDRQDLIDTMRGNDSNRVQEALRRYYAHKEAQIDARP